MAEVLREVFAEPQLLFVGADRVGDRMEVLADLVSGLLDGGTIVRLAARGRL